MAKVRAWAGYAAGVALIVLALCKVLPAGVAAVGFVLGIVLLVVTSLVNLRRSARGSGVVSGTGMYVGDGGASDHHQAHGGQGGFTGHGGFGGHGGGHGGHGG